MEVTLVLSCAWSTFKGINNVTLLLLGGSPTLHTSVGAGDELLPHCLNERILHMLQQLELLVNLLSLSARFAKLTIITPSSVA